MSAANGNAQSGELCRLMVAKVMTPLEAEKAQGLAKVYVQDYRRKPS